MDDNLTLLARFNTIALVALVLWMGVLSSMILTSSAAKKDRPIPAAEERRPYVFKHWPNRTRYPVDANHIAECTNARSFSLCCTNQSAIWCGVPATLVKLQGSLFDYQLEMAAGAGLGAQLVECRLYCRKM